MGGRARANGPRRADSEATHLRRTRPDTEQSRRGLVEWRGWQLGVMTFFGGAVVRQVWHMLGCLSCFWHETARFHQRLHCDFLKEMLWSVYGCIRVHAPFRCAVLACTEMPVSAVAVFSAAVCASGFPLPILYSPSAPGPGSACRPCIGLVRSVQACVRCNNLPSLVP